MQKVQLTQTERELFCLTEQSELQPGMRVAVAMSGGVDSTAVALLLQAYGCEVSGVVFKMTPCSLINVQQARSVAERLEIPLEVVDLSSQFEQQILQYFFRDYQRGRTPSPCVHCNRMIKLQQITEYAAAHQCLLSCTGHYVRRLGDCIYCAEDRHKDQSYFLGETSLATLRRCFFPLGKARKAQIYEFVQAHHLEYFHTQGESQDLCFADLPAYRDFFAKAQPRGTIVNTAGVVLGEHYGVQHYTIGQRKGLGIGGGQPYYVVRIQADEQRVIVGNKAELERSQLQLERVNILATKVLQGKEPINCWAKIRYNTPMVTAICQLLSGQRVHLQFATPVLAIAPGQWCALYQQTSNGYWLLGGGWIQ